MSLCRVKICQRKRKITKYCQLRVDEIKTLVSDISAMLNYYNKIEDLTKLEAQQIIDKKKGEMKLEKIQRKSA